MPKTVENIPKINQIFTNDNGMILGNSSHRSQQTMRCQTNPQRKSQWHQKPSNRVPKQTPQQTNKAHSDKRENSDIERESEL